MKQIAASEPLCYRLPQSQLVDSLPYIDEDVPQLKSKVLYLIRAEQQLLPFSQQMYLKDLALPSTPFSNSQKFMQEAKRILGKAGEQKNKKQKINLFDIPVIDHRKVPEEVKEKVRRLQIKSEGDLLKEVNLEIYEKFGPLVLKQSIAALKKRKELLVVEIEKQKQQIELINQRRRYRQLQAQQRAETIRSRIEIMIHKKKKVQ